MENNCRVLGWCIVFVKMPNINGEMYRDARRKKKPAENKSIQTAMNSRFIDIAKNQ